MCLQKSLPPVANFLKSITGQFVKLPTCACRNSPPPVCTFVKSTTGKFAKLPTCACRNSTQPVADFLKSSTGQFANLPICACRNSHPHSLQILWNLPLDSFLSYLYVLAEIPPPQFADFLKSATGQFAKLAIMCFKKFPPPVYRFSEICHWTDW